MIDENIVQTPESARGLTQELHQKLSKRRQATDKEDTK